MAQSKECLIESYIIRHYTGNNHGYYFGYTDEDNKFYGFVSSALRLFNQDYYA